MASQDPIDGTLVAVLTEPRSVSSDFARYEAQQLAALASKGFITTRVPGKTNTYGRMWRVTVAGLAHLTEKGLT